MKIIIEQILQNDMVSYSSKFGNGIAKWNDSNPQYKEYEAEIDIEEILIWGSSIIKSSQNKASISYSEGISSFIGKLESIDDDGYSVIRLENAIISFCTEGKPFEIGSIIEIRSKNIEISSCE